MESQSAFNDSPEALRQITDGLDNEMRNYFAVLGHVVPENERIFGLVWLSFGWDVSIERAEEIINILVAADLVQFRKTVAGEKFYSMRDTVRLYAKTILLQDDGPEDS